MKNEEITYMNKNRKAGSSYRDVFNDIVFVSTINRLKLLWEYYYLFSKGKDSLALIGEVCEQDYFNENIPIIDKEEIKNYFDLR